MVSKAPNLFIIGAPRSGTTSLYAALKQHPDIYTSVLKEPHFYARDLPLQPHTITEDTHYRCLFEAAEDQAYRAEGSVWYFFSEQAPQAIAQQHSEAKIILLLRHPVEFLISLYHLYRRSGNEAEADINIALLREHPPDHDGVYFPFGLTYLQRLHYSQCLARWQQCFPPQQLKICWYEDFYRAPQQAFAELCRWLSVADDHSISFDRDEAKRRVQMMALRQIRALPKEVKRKLNRKASNLHMGVKSQSLSAATRAEIEAYFLQHNQALPQQLAGQGPWPEAWQGLLNTLRAVS
jgi:hypothetical protein